MQPTSVTPPDVWEQSSWKAAVFTALFVAVVALVQGIWSLWERRRDLRWKRAELARQLTDTLWEWPASHIALTLVDEGGGLYSLEGFGTHYLHPETVIPRALRRTTRGLNEECASHTQEDRFVRKCFDVLLYSLERIEHSIEIGVVNESDITVPAAYYAGQLGWYKEDIQGYAVFAGFHGALKFLARFDAWKKR